MRSTAARGRLPPAVLVLHHWGAAPWLTEGEAQRYREVWDASLTGGLNYYRASPLRPPRRRPRRSRVTLPREMLTVDIPTLVLWAMEDVALPPELVEGWTSTCRT
jgi:pimeloyl-ACP methyl ester carboxylesterase